MTGKIALDEVPPGVIILPAQVLHIISRRPPFQATTTYSSSETIRLMRFIQDGESRNKSSIVYVDLKLRGLLRSAEKSTGMDGKFTVEEIRLDTNGRGRPYAAWAEFAAYVDDVRKFDDPATDGKPRLERLMQLLQVNSSVDWKRRRSPRGR